MDINGYKSTKLLFQQGNRKYKVFLELKKTWIQIIELENINIMH